MSDINVFLRDNLKAVSNKNMFIVPEIPDKKLNNAVASCDYSGSISNVIAIFDNTLFGSGKEGLLFTGEQLIYRPSFSEPIKIQFRTIASIDYVETAIDGKSDKIDVSINIKTHEGQEIVIKNLMDCDYKKLTEVLKHSISAFKEFKEEKQFVPLEQMSELLKSSYVKIAINMANSGGIEADSKIFAEILLLINRLNFNSQARLVLRTCFLPSDKIVSFENLISDINSECPSGQEKMVHISLVKDLINLYLCAGGDDVQKFSFLQSNRHLVMVTDNEIDLALDAIKNDRKMIEEDYTDDQIISALKEISAKAAAIGTPLAAVYLSGSVIGLSAAGITSGLAALGMGGILGFSGMVSGLGVAVLIGVGVYKGVRKLTGSDEIGRSKRRELMLNEIIKQTQGTIALVMEYANFIIQNLNQCIIDHGIQSEKVKKLMAMMSKMTSAGAVLASRADAAQSSAIKLKCAQCLDENKLKILTRDPVKSELYGFVLEFYEERVFVEDKDGQKNDVSKMILKNNLSKNDLEKLAEAFEVVGYFNVGDVLKGTASDVANKAKEAISGWFS